MKKRVGVITVHKNTNYGANLQAYASCSYINDLGYDCEIIDYVPKSQEISNHLWTWIWEIWKNDSSKSIVRKVKLFVAILLLIPCRYTRLKRFAKFREKFCKISPSCSKEKDAIKLNYEAVVCGSDQIWNPLITDGVTPIYYGEIEGVKNRISYAASIGKECFSKEDEIKVSKLVKKIDYCSVREESSAKYIGKLSGKKVSCVCDPVFLLSKEKYEKISARAPMSEKYVLVYSIIPNTEMIEIARRYANENGMVLVEICASKNRRCSHKQLTDLGPREFLSYMQYADMIFTNSFHGTAFSIIFEREFYAIDNKSGGSRIVNLLNKAGLNNRLIAEYPADSSELIDYAVVKKQLESHIGESKEFLEKALNTEKKELIEKKCVGCGACEAICHIGAISLLPTNEGFLQSIVDSTKCVNCGRCQEVCPILNDSQMNDVKNVYGFKAENGIREKSASGGAFSALAEVVFQNKGVVWGVTQNDDFKIEHIKCDSSEEIRRLQGTKYVQSNMQDVFWNIEKDLNEGKTVLFSGTPCQVDAVKCFAKTKNIDSDRLYLVDIICHGVPSPKVYKDFIEWLAKQKKSKVNQYYFRNKNISWRGNSCYVVLENGENLKNDLYASAYMNLYYSNHITRTSCYTCKYTTTRRCSDLTIGDYWGIENACPEFEDNLGVSVVLVNTEKGRELFEKIQGNKCNGNIETLKQPQLSSSCLEPNNRDEFWKEYNQKGIQFVLKKHGGISVSLKSRLWNLKKQLEGIYKK